MKRLVTRTTLTMLAFAIVGDCGLIGGVLLARAQLAAVHRQYGTGGSPGVAPTPDGFGQSGGRIEPGRARGGVAVRYASSGCPYCRKDAEWKRLAQRLQQQGIDVVVLLPKPNDAFASDELVPTGAQQLTNVSMGWLKTYPVSVTPTLLIFNADRKLIWHHTGMLSAAKADEVMDAVRRAGSSR